MNIETNGSVVPEDSVAFAARIIDEQLKMFINFEEPIEEVSAPAVEEPTLNVNLLRKVEELELSVRSANCLKMMKSSTLEIWFRKQNQKC